MMKENEIINKYFAEESIGVALGKTLEHIFNYFGSDTTAKEATAYLLRNCHRTILQSITRGVFIYLRALSKVEYYDARNEASVKVAKVAIKAIDDEDIGFPLI